MEQDPLGFPLTNGFPQGSLQRSKLLLAFPLPEGGLGM